MTIISVKDFENGFDNYLDRISQGEDIAIEYEGRLFEMVPVDDNG